VSDLHPVSRRHFLRYSALGLAGLAGLSIFPNSKSIISLAASSNPIIDENNLPGNTDWKLIASADIKNLQIKGYASATSVNKGDSINFHVATNPPNQTYNIDIYRMGWYNGAGSRKMLSVGPFTATAATTNLNNPPYYSSPPSTPDPDSFGTVACNWPVGYTLNVPATWTTGVYLVKLSTTFPNPYKENYIHFVVRDDNSTADLLFQCSVTTYQAYNGFGGKSLYPDNSINGAAVKVSFDRPYLMTSALTVGTTTIDQGAGNFLSWELPTLRFLEMNGYNVAYCTDIDLHNNPALMNNHKAFLSVGHDEYWSRAMYDNALAFRSNGKHLAFLGANEIYWQIRMESSASNVANRVMVCYKLNYASDPDYIARNYATTTYLWRELPPGAANPAYSRPENQLVGVMYDGTNNNYPGADFAVNNSGHWVYAGTGFSDWTHVPGIVGYEWDKRVSNGLEPAGLVQLSGSPVTTGSGASSTSNATIYQASSGSWVFATGTIFWAYALDYVNNIQTQDLRNTGIQRATRNVLDFFVNISIDSISPAVVSQNSGAFTLTVTGSNFVNGAVVKWNGANRTTTFVNSGKLTAQIDATDLQTTGVFPISVTNPDNTTSQPVNLTVTVAPPLAVNSLAPTSISQLENAFTLTVNGSGFVSGAVVKWNGSARTTSFVNSSVVTAQILASDIQFAGTFPITVSNPDNTTTSAINFAVVIPVVTNPVDGGEASSSLAPGTLSYALKHTRSGDTILFSNLGPANKVKVNGKLPAVPAGVNLDGGSCGGSRVVIDGAGVNADGLMLAGHTRLRNLKIENFGGRQVVGKVSATSSQETSSNKSQCTVIAKVGN
jgi:hypothetical protein